MRKGERLGLHVCLFVCFLLALTVLGRAQSHVRVNGVGTGGFNGQSDTYAGTTSSTSGLFWNASGWWDLKVAGSVVGNITGNGVYGGGNFGTQLMSSGIQYPAVAFASLGTPSNGAVKYCSDCTVANPCASGGTGAIAKRLNGAWVCN